MALFVAEFEAMKVAGIHVIMTDVDRCETHARLFCRMAHILPVVWPVGHGDTSQSDGKRSTRYYGALLSEEREGQSP